MPPRDLFARSRQIAGQLASRVSAAGRALGERSEFRRQRDEAIGERREFLRQRDEAIGERSEYLRQRDEAIGERGEFLRQRDEAIGQANLLSDRLARHIHRADVAARRAAISLRSGSAAPMARPAVATRDCILLFLHLAKTGGVTLADIFTRNLAVADFLVIDMGETCPSANGAWSHIAIEKAMGRMQESGVNNLRFIWGHFRHGIQAHLPKPGVCMTLLRDPLDRVISSHYYWDNLMTKLGESLGDYLDRHPHCPVYMDNYMTRMLSGMPYLDPLHFGATTQSHPAVTEIAFERAAENLDGYLVVGLTDQFDETLLLLGSDLGWSLSDLVYSRQNVTVPRPAIADVPDSVRSKVLEWNRYDAELVKRGRAHIARRIAAYPGDFHKDLALFRKLNALFRQGASVEVLRSVEYDGLACLAQGSAGAGRAAV
jgi:hypothetical protein